MTTPTPAQRLATLDGRLSDYWLAPFFPVPGATREDIRKRGLAEEATAMKIVKDADAEGDIETASAARKLATRLRDLLARLDQQTW